MKHLCKPLATALAILNSPFSILNSSAAVPLEWTARPGETAPAQFTRHHGETLELRCRFAGFGDQPFSQGADIRLWYQTNGMSSAWWSVPAQAASNTLSAVFAPESDPGADLVRLFFGAPSNVFASAVLRLTHSPGFAPASLPLPTPVLDFAAVELRNISALTNGWSFGGEPADYESVSNRAMSAVQPAEMEAAIAAIPAPDYSTNNAVLVATIGAKAPRPDLTPTTNYTAAALASATNNLRSKADLTVYGETTAYTAWTIRRDGVDVTAQVRQPFWNAEEIPGIPVGWDISSAMLSGEGRLDGGVLTGLTPSATNLEWLAVGGGFFYYSATRSTYPVLGPTEDRLATTNQLAVIAELQAQLAALSNAIAAASGADEWNRPGEWTLGYSAIPISPVLSHSEVVTNADTGVIVSNATVTETQSLAANIYSYQLDELSMSPAPAVTLSCNAAGASLSGSVLTASTNGTYNVRGTSPDGVTRSVQVPMYVTTLTDQHKSTYIGDTNGSARAVVNDTMWLALMDAANSECATLDYPTDRGANPPGQFTGWRTITPTWAWPGVGNYNPWAIAPKVLVSASHWIRRPSNPIQLYDSVGGTNFFVSVGYWEHLDTWARTNGFTDAESRAADRADICLGGIVEGYVPDACLPYLADAAELDALFGGTIDGVMAWHYPRGTTEDTCGTTEQAGNLYTWCIPVLLNVDGPTADTPIHWTGPAYMTDANDTNVRADILALIGKYDANNWWRVRGGDSGRPVFIRWGQYDIPVAETHRTTMGGSIPAAATIIRAFCAQHGCTPKSLPH